MMTTTKNRELDRKEREKNAENVYSVIQWWELVMI